MMDIELIANSLMRRDFIEQIQPYINEKCRIINLNVSPRKWYINKDTNKAVVTDGKYPKPVQDCLDKLDKIIEQIGMSYQNEETKRNYMFRARRIIDKQEYKSSHYR